MNWLRNFMMGRYGADPLNFALLIFYLVLVIAANFIPLAWLRMLLMLLAVAVVLLCLFRMFSRNTAKRWQENQKFLALSAPLRKWFSGIKKRFHDRKTHRYYHCPKCKNTLRVPKGKGKIQITCPVCHTEFVKKT